MSRSRITFFAIIIFAVTVVVVGLALQSITTTNQNVSATAGVHATLTATWLPANHHTPRSPVLPRRIKTPFASDSVSQFLALDALDGAGLNPGSDVTMIPADSVDDAVNRFNKGQADVVSGWLPNIQNAKQSSGQDLIGSDKLHVLVDVIMTSRQALPKRPPAVQAFHNACCK